MGSVEPTSRAGVALDLILKTLIASQDFNHIQSKNWEAISRLVPGTTAGMVARRYEELLFSGDLLPFDQFEKNMTGQGGSLPSGMSDSDLSKNSSRPCSAKPKGSKDDKDLTGKDISSDLKSGDKGPMMVIHVCDEAKSLKQDFQCPRDLLVQEMKYFAEYLSTDAQRWEEVDISVHCDVQIFEWLMRYVKRSDVSDKPKLAAKNNKRQQMEPNNVISILISSDFLKMDSLVQECIEYCHGNMSAIVSTPCNMNCINDKLVGRIADLFSHNEADDIKDRKDKFKSKLFAKKLEKLFEPDFTNQDCLENASTLFRCSICKKMLTRNLERKVKCMPSRMTIDKRGQLTFCHIRDPTFDVNQYLIDLKTQLKSWREVYWRMWGTVHYQMCSRCGETFSCTDYGHCKYHPEPPRYDNEMSSSSYVGTYPCCHQKCLRFDPTQQNKGCRVRDHVVNVAQVNPGSENDLQSQLNKVNDDLLSHRDVICVPYQRLSDASEMELNVFANEEFASNSRSEGVAISSVISGVEDDSKTDSARPVPRLQALTIDREVSFEYDDIGFGESDDEIGDDEQPKGTARKGRGLKKSRVTIDPQAILMDAPGFDQNKKSAWDTGRSMRYNQDAQRSEDLRRMKEIRVYLTKLRLNPEKIERPKKEYAGGVFCRLESQWKAQYLQQQAKQQAQAQLRLSRSNTYHTISARKDRRSLSGV
ncbi:SANT and BTB domain regulator of class switch recombination-like isoform X3 [Ruditapes philippinarum]|uniref:SANT and BTB domain regulator of class switch recombination-like isoform X3 n=1 Tax=Ruditapes philippinarum TaxID=129788 RepID=UPI00295B2B37|nr:SANT and BTB domain regulator of class switch recombination-like isoform X3 [Ruditapes philippinarum]